MFMKPARFPLALAVVLIAFNLRPALSSLAPVVVEIMAGTGLSASGASLLSTAPVLCLGVFAATAPILARHLGLERATLFALAALVAGLALRGLGGVPTLVVGSLGAGAGIGIANVLLPSLLKRDFSDRLPLMTGIYAMALCIGAAAGAGATAPVLHAAGGDWRVALGFWTWPALLALLTSLIVWRRGLHHGGPVSIAPSRTSLWRDRLAWQVTFYMGLQSMLAYSMFSWAAPILRDRGDSAVTAGLVVSISVLSQVGASLPVPILAAKLRNQSVPAALSIVATTGGFLGLLWAPLALQWVCAVVLGLGMGGAFSCAVLLMVMRAPNGATAARLSSMAQSVGYAMGSLGPLLVGVVHDATGDWSGAVAVFLLGGTGAAIAGALAGRARFVRS